MRFAGWGIMTTLRSSWKRTVMALLPLLVFLWNAPAQAAYRVTDISFSRSTREMCLNIRTDGPVQYDFFTMDETQPQLVIDLSNAVHALGRYHFESPAADIIQRVRTSQYRPYPAPVVRIVLDFRDMVPYEIKAVKQGLAVTLSTPSDVQRISDGDAQKPGPPEREEPAARPVAAGRTEGYSIGTSGKAVDEPKPAIVAEAGGEPKEDQALRETAEKTTAGKVEAQPGPPMHAEPSGAKPAPAESSPSGSSEPENAATAVAQTAVTKAEPDTAADDPQPGSLMARLTALGIREPVSYHSGDRRDPFVPLPARQEVEFGQAPLPDVAKLSIVGILRGVDGYRALAQDDEDNGYVLRQGDRVLYGYVARIEAERVIFYLNRRGLDRTVILKIPQ